MARAKQRKLKIECDHCEESCTIQFTKKSICVQCCPFCGENVSVVDDDRPLLNTFEDLDEFSEDRYYDEDDVEDEEEDD